MLFLGLKYMPVIKVSLLIYVRALRVPPEQNNSRRFSLDYVIQEHGRRIDRLALRTLPITSIDSRSNLLRGTTIRICV